MEGILTVSASGNCPRVILVFTKIGTQSLVAHAPFGSAPQTCPIRRHVAEPNLLLAMIYKIW
jgi:hypothetical protein